MSLTSNTDNEMLKQLDNISEEIEILKFKKFSNIAPELRIHVLTFSDKNTLHAYSQCSEKCNAEVQMFNTEAPKTLHINQYGNAVDVRLVYELRLNDGFQKMVDVGKQFVLDEISDTMDEIGIFLRKCYKRVKTGNTAVIFIDMKKWSSQMLDVPYLAKIKEWNVIMYASMVDECMEYFKTNRDNIEEICIGRGDNEEVTIPSGFFKLPFVRKLKIGNFLAPCSIENADFVNLQIETLHMSCSIDFEAIRERVKHVNANDNIKMGYLKITLPEDDDRKFELDKLFPNQPISYYRGRIDYCYIGKICAHVQNEKVLILSDKRTSD